MRRGILLRASLAGLVLISIPLVLGIATEVPAGAQAETHRVPEGIDPDGDVDVTDELVEFIESVPDGDVVELAPDARYRVDGSLVLEDRHDLTIEGNGATIFAVTRGDRERSQWVLDAGSNLVFRDLTVRGANPSGGTESEAYVAELEAQHGFQVDGTRGLELDRITVEDVYGDFVYLSRDDDHEWSSDVWIHDSSFARNGRQGIAVVAGRDIVIERNELIQTRRATFDLEPNTPSGWGVENVHILDNDIGPGRLLFLASHGNGPVDDVVVSGNRLRGRVLSIDVQPPEGQRRSNWIITDNESNAELGAPRLMRFFRVDGLEVAGNHQAINRIEDAPIQLWDVCGEEIADNLFPGTDLSVARVEGEACDADLAVPEPPAIPAREEAIRAGDDRAEPASRPGPDDPEPAPAPDRIDPSALEPETNWAAVLWRVLGAVALAGGVGGLIWLAASRRRPTGPDAE